MPQDSLEDRIFLAGKHDDFKKTLAAHRADKINDQELYDALIDYGAEPEEADEFVYMLLAEKE